MCKMTCRPLFILLFVLSISARSTTPVFGRSTLPVTSNDILEDLLCPAGPSPSSNAVTFELSTSSIYTINPGDFCIIENVTNLTIRGNDSSSPAIIRCLSDDSLSTRGFAFINAQGLTFANVVFENCGAMLTKEVLGQANSSFFYFGQGESAALVCNNCCNLTLSNVTIRNYTGRAFVGLDVFGDSTLDTVVISDNVYDNNTFHRYKGSGMIWMYTDTMLCDRSSCDGSTTVTVTNSEFSNNKYYFTADESQNFLTGCADRLTDSFYTTNSEFEPIDLPIVGAMTLIYQQHFPVHMKITNSSFVKNIGQCFGAILAIYLSEAEYSSLHFSHCIFSNNSESLSTISNGGRRYFGSVITLHIKYLGNYSENYDCLKIDNSNFIEMGNTSQVSITQFPDNSGFCLASLQHITSGNTRLLYVSSISAGDSLDVYLSDIHLVGDRVYDSPSLEEGYGILTFSFVTRITIENSEFRELNGPVISAEATFIIFTGNVTFDSAVGASWTGGAAIFLMGESIIWLKESLHLTFYNNSAFQGGAIFSISRFAEYCAIQFITKRVYHVSNIDKIDIKVTFVSNKARVAGNSMYISPLKSCSLRLSPNIEVDPTTVYNQVFKFESPVGNGLLEVSSNPMQVCMCGRDPKDTNRSALMCKGDTVPSVNTFPGKTFELSVVPVDENFTRVYSLVYSDPQPQSADVLESNFDWHLGYGEDIVQAQGYNCTTLTFTIFSANVLSRKVNGYISIYPAGSINGLFIPVVLMNCPPGLELVNGTDSCGCPKLLTELVDENVRCNASNGLISRPGTSWIGIALYSDAYQRYRPIITAEDVVIGYSDQCPTRYCNQSASLVNVSNSNVSVWTYWCVVWTV